MAFRRFDDTATPAGTTPERVKNGLRPSYVCGGAMQVSGGDLDFYVGSAAGVSIAPLRITSGTSFLFTGWPLHDVFVAQVTAGATLKAQVVVADSLEEAMTVR